MDIKHSLVLALIFGAIGLGFSACNSDRYEVNTSYSNTLNQALKACKTTECREELL